jgi:hypothetical protein
MVRFDQMIREGMTVREIRTQYPRTAPLLQSYGFRDACDDCSLRTLAHKHGLSSSVLVEELNRAAFAPAED